MAIITRLTEEIAEEGHAGFQCVFTDEAGSAVTPDTLTWTLTDEAGNVINSRQDVAVSSPSSTETIVLSGDDLQIGTNGTVRKLLLEWTFDSSLGTDLPAKAEVHFEITNIQDVS